MEKTRDGYLIPEEGNEEEEIEAIEHNTILGGEKWRSMTQEQRHEHVKKQAIFQEEEKIKKAPRGYAVGGLKLDNYIDNVEQFWKKAPFFYDKSQIFWLWNATECKYEITDEIGLMNLIDDELGFAGQTVTNKIKGNYIEAFKRVGRKKVPKELPPEWLQFKNKLINLKTGDEKEAKHTFFITNPIPHEIGQSEDTPVLDKMLEDWVGKKKKTLYEVIAYCLYRDYPIHTIISLVGCGRNGKSTFLRILERFVGHENITTAELEKLSEGNFEKAKLYKKLVCHLGETNFGLLERTSVIKSLTGQDLVSFEFKNKNAFDGHNYAKIIISSNSLPVSTDTSEGFYRRWVIVDFDKIFPEGKDILINFPEIEFNNLARKSVKILKELLSNGGFSHQGTIEERKHAYINASNPISIFLKEKCEFGDPVTHYVKSNELYKAYVLYLSQNKRRIVKRKEFNTVLAEEGLFVEKMSKRNENDEFETHFWILGIKLRQDSDNSDNSDVFLPSSLRVRNEVQNQYKLSELSESKSSLTSCELINLENNDKNESMNWSDCESLLIDRENHEIPKYRLEELGANPENIQKWITTGSLIEIKPGILRLN